MKKKSLLLIILLLVITLTIGASYALWQATHKQENKNVVSIGCFNLESDIGTSGEQAPISLMDAMPISDAQGMSLTPFTFTITNTCNMYAAYQVNLETLSATTLGPDYLKVALSSNTPAVLSSYLSVSPTITGANASNKLISGGLRQGESITYDLRLWLDESTPRDAGSNKIYNGKISISASPAIDDSAVATIKNLVKGEPTNTLDVITKEAPDSTCTNTLAYDGTVDNSLRYVGANPCNYACLGDECPELVDAYQAYLDGMMITNRFGTYDSEEACTSQLTENRNIKNELGIDGELTCELDSSTNKYAVVGHGFIKNYGNHASEEACMANMYSWGLTYQSSTTPPSTITCQKNEDKMASGGWRIIGLINNVDNGSGKKEQRVKLIRNESLGNYSWDLSPKTVNNGYGINQWGATDTYEGADLMRELNTDYLNYNLTSNPMWYGYQSGYSDSNYNSGYGQNTEFDKSKALSASAQELIGDAVWYTGAYNDTNIGSSAVTTPASYQNEKSDNTNATNNGKYCSSGTYCNDTVTRTFTWTGKVALMNVSDYGYAVGGLSRSTCLTTNLSSYSSNSCSTNDWLLYGTWQWSLSPYAYTSNADAVGYVNDVGNVNGYVAFYFNAVRPAVYLLSSSQISEGNGSATSPYKFD